MKTDTQTTHIQKNGRFLKYIYFIFVYYHIKTFLNVRI